MIQLIREQNYLESLKNLKDLQELGTHDAHKAAWGIATGLVLYHRGQMLKFERAEQEKQWDRETSGTAVLAVMVCVAVSAVLATALAWYWWSCWLAIAAAGMAYVAFSHGEEDSCPK